MASEEQANQTREVAEELMDAYTNAVCADFIVSDTGDLSRNDVRMLRNALQHVVDNLDDVLTALVAGKLAEME